jgi:hypothetical protein
MSSYTFDPSNVKDRELRAFRLKANGIDVVKAVCIENSASQPIPVNIVSESVSGAEIKSIYDEAPSVGAGSETSIVSYTVPLTKSAKLLRVEFTGENIAVYNLYINSVKQAKHRTYFGGSLSGVLNFSGGTADGLPLIEGDILLLRVLHDRPSSGDFEGRIQVVEIQE